MKTYKFKFISNPAIVGTLESTFLMRGEIIDRFGGLSGNWFSTNPGLSPSIFEVRYPWSKPLLINPPSGYFSQSLPFTQGTNILSAPSLRAPGTTNLLIRSGAEVGSKLQ